MLSLSYLRSYFNQIQINFHPNHFDLFPLSVESCTTLLSKELKRNLFQLFATWSGSLSKPLGVMYHVSSGTQISTDDERLQFSALQVCLTLTNPFFSLHTRERKYFETTFCCLGNVCTFVLRSML